MLKFPALLKLQESVELPEPVTVVGEIAHSVLLVAKAMRAENPSIEVAVVVRMPVDPLSTVTDGCIAVIVKS